MRLALGLAVVLASPTLLANNGDLDTTFNGGAFNVSTGGTGSYAYTMMLQPDGRAIVGGLTYNGVNSYWTLVRRKPNGLKDPTFGGGTGQVVLAVGDLASNGGYFGYVFDLAVQPNGKIVGIGPAYDAASASYVTHLKRWLADGSADLTFGNGGDRVVTFPGLVVETNFLALQEDGKIVVGGEYDHPDGKTWEPVVLRYKTNGNLDTTFGSGGMFLMPGTYPTGRKDRVAGIGIRPDGTIVASVSQESTHFPREPEIFQLTRDGALDTSFGSAGISTFLFGVKHGWSYYGFTVLPDGKIVGTASNDAGTIGYVYRLQANGSLDTTFGGGWINSSTSLWALGGSPVGQILYSHERVNNSHYVETLRVTTAGNTDTTFTNSSGDVGTVETPIPTSDPRMTSLKMQSDGRFIVAGETGEVAGESDQILLARYQGDPLVLTPAALNFTSVTGVPVSTVQVSNVITIASLTPSAMVPITVVGGSYSVNGAPFTALLGYVKNGDQVMVKHTSAATSGTSIITKLKVGGINDSKSLWAISGTQIVGTFTSTTQ